MAPRQSPAEAWYSPTLVSPSMSEAGFAQLRRIAAAHGIDGAQVFKAGSTTPEGRGSTFYPLFVSAIAAGLVPPFSEFFFSVLRHYKLEALHLHPNSVLLLAIFAYYCEAHVGVQPSVAVGVLGTGVPRLTCLRPAAWLKGGPARPNFINTRPKTLARGQA